MFLGASVIIGYGRKIAKQYNMHTEFIMNNANQDILEIKNSLERLFVCLFVCFERTLPHIVHIFVIDNSYRRLFQDVINSGKLVRQT